MALTTEEQKFYDFAKAALPDWMPDGDEFLMGSAKMFGAVRTLIVYLLAQTKISTATGPTYDGGGNMITPDWLHQHALDRGTGRQASEDDVTLRARLRNVPDALTRESILDATNAILAANGLPETAAMVELPRDAAHTGTYQPDLDLALGGTFAAAALSRWYLTKTAGGTGSTGGASSVQTIAGDGYVEVTVVSGQPDVIFGLSLNDPDLLWNTVDYALDVVPLMTATVFENGVGGASTTFVAGDRVRVERIDTTVYYKKNGVTFATSAVPSTGPLMIDITMYDAGSTLDGITFVDDGEQKSITWQNVVNTTTSPETTVFTPNDPFARPPYRDPSIIRRIQSFYLNVVATNPLNTGSFVINGISGNGAQFFNDVGSPAADAGADWVVGKVGRRPLATMEKTAGGAAAWDAGASSFETITGDGYVESIARSVTTDRIFGFSDVDPNASWNTVDYAIHLDSGGTWAPLQNGTYLGGFPYVVGDVLRIERVGTTVYYKKNGVTAFTSGTPSSGPLRVDTSIHQLNATLELRMYNVAESRYVPLSWQNRTNVTISSSGLDGKARAYCRRGYRVAGSRPAIVIMLPYGTTAGIVASVREMLRQKKAAGVRALVERRLNP